MNAEVRQIKTAAEQGLAEAFAAASGRLPGAADVAALRAAAFRRFEAQGLPHRRIEEWKYTDLRALMREARPLAEPPGAAEKAYAKNAGAMLAATDARRIVFVDGTLVPELSDLAALEPGVTIRPLAQALVDNDPVVARHLGTLAPAGDVAVALNTAFMGDGAVIQVADGTAPARPIHLIFTYAGKPAAFFPRSLVEVGKGGRLALFESHESADGRDDQVIAALELVIGEAAHVDHIKIGVESRGALHVATLMADVGARARFNSFTFTTGSAVTRNQLFVRCAGKDSTLRIGGASLLTGRQHADTTLVLDHVAVGCQSRQTFKAVLDDQSRGIFQGKIIVRPGAQKTNAKMLTQALLLSEAAEADHKPELEIFADDVQCGHGATTGALDENLKFYMTARGIPEREAEALLIQAFVGEAVEGIEHAGLRDTLMAAISHWLGARA
jgi:Fe-S cluster assembly protein SufD